MSNANTPAMMAQSMAESLFRDNARLKKIEESYYRLLELDSGDVMVDTLNELDILRTEVASLKEEQRKDSADMLRLIADIRYVAGIAERGRGKPLGDGEKFTQAVLDYVKSLESQLASLNEEAQEDAIVRDALILAKDVINILWVSHHANRADAAIAAIDAAMSVKSEDARDAARYRWLRYNSGYTIRCTIFDDVSMLDHNDADLDAAIDAAIAISAEDARDGVAR